MELNIRVPQWFATMITINLELQIIKTEFTKYDVRFKLLRDTSFKSVADLLKQAFSTGSVKV